MVFKFEKPDFKNMTTTTVEGLKKVAQTKENLKKIVPTKQEVKKAGKWALKEGWEQIKSYIVASLIMPTNSIKAPNRDSVPLPKGSTKQEPVQMVVAADTSTENLYTGLFRNAKIVEDGKPDSKETVIRSQR